MKLLSLLILGSMTLLMACGAGRQQNDSAAVIEETSEMQPAAFDADSAYAYVARQMDFGARVPGSEAHSRTAQWLASELERHGAMVYQQRAELKAFDGTILQAVNIAGSYNTQATDRVLLLAHWDSRPWADRDSVVANRSKPVPGANDGASGVGVLLEIARQLGIKAPLVGVDILFVDAEDWGTDNQDDSWALGARYFAENWPSEIGKPQMGVLLDMVGGRNAQFCREQFSMYYAPELVNQLWGTAESLGYGDTFNNEVGGAVTDDHLQFIRIGIPTIDIIEFHPLNGFNRTWHTTADDMNIIDAATLGAVGTTTITWLRGLK